MVFLIQSPLKGRIAKAAVAVVIDDVVAAAAKHSVIFAGLPQVDGAGSQSRVCCTGLAAFDPFCKRF